MENLQASILNGNIDSQKLTLQASIPFSYLKNKVRFTYMEEPTYDPYSFESDNPESLSEAGGNNFYQRRINEERIKGIKKFIRTTILNELNNRTVGVLFPTALLLAANSNEPIEESSYISIPELLSDGQDFFIVDGQHRLFSMMELYKDITNQGFPSDDDKNIIRYLDNYRFNCTILLNYDLWEQARVFADVNFNQKKVDRSLYYSIYGMHYSQNNEELRNNYIFIAHHLTNFLNTSPASPLKGKIKMLGNGKGVISQSFFADGLIRHIKSPRGVWYVDSTQDKTQGNYRYMAKEIITFFTAIKNVFPYQWPVDTIQRSIILKTTGIGALLRLMGYIHRNYLDDDTIEALNTTDDNYLVERYYNKVFGLLSPLCPKGEALFGFNGDFSGTGGRGLESRLYKTLCTLIGGENGVAVGYQEIDVNGVAVKAIFYRTNDDFYTFELSHYFQNADQISPYIPGSGAIAESLDNLKFKLRLYLDQIQPTAIAYPNSNFDYNLIPH